jgi:hypothetical protein
MTIQEKIRKMGGGKRKDEIEDNEEEREEGGEEVYLWQGRVSGTPFCS